jgi:hypothetical protein
LWLSAAWRCDLREPADIRAGFGMQDTDFSVHPPRVNLSSLDLVRVHESPLFMFLQRPVIMSSLKHDKYAEPLSIV